MPNRIIKESICSSDSIDTLSWFEEVLFYRLIVNCDDFGRFDARPALLKARLFPLKEGVTHKQIEAALSKLSTAGMVQVYMYDQKPFLQLVSWAKHQTVRNKRSKYPEPTADESTCMQLHADVPVIQSESESNPIPADAVREIVDYLNLRTGKAFKSGTKGTQSHINARLREGFVVGDFKRVIDDRVRTWGTPSDGKDMSIYLRPETLFGTKFEGYLNGIPKMEKRQTPIKRSAEEIADYYGIEVKRG